MKQIFTCLSIDTPFSWKEKTPMAENAQVWLPETEKNNCKIDYAGGGKYCLFQSEGESIVTDIN